ncbi:MAG: 50S ribosomal protein L6 [Anaerolineaceae bacterium]|nr:50S ribosomal protein L6 [Anaerolineaceae bacterium]
MSRIGKLPVVVVDGVDIKINGSEVKVKGPKGEMKRLFSPQIGIKIENNEVIVTRNSDEPAARALHGTTRALISNMVTGVTTGFTKTLEIQGVGYRVEQSGKSLTLHVGYSHPVVVEPLEGIEFEADPKTRTFKVHGMNKEIVGQVASDIRKIRPPEPYKGKGIRYLGEYVRRKAGKTAQA